MRSFVDSILALPVALLPKRVWDNWDLPVANVALVSSLLTLFAGAALGISGFFAYMANILRAQEWTAPPLMIGAFAAYVFATPRGVFSLYLTITGLVRAVAWYVDESHGDPILTGLDRAWRRLRRTQQQQRETQARQALEKIDEPDRLYDGEWAGLPEATYVVVSARRKPDWSKGTWVITSDGWFTLGEPFDRPMPNGLRTIYPLTMQTTTLEVLRKGVSYELPPLRKATKRPSPIGD